jgi:hypothetical protein
MLQGDGAATPLDVSFTPVAGARHRRFAFALRETQLKPAVPNPHGRRPAWNQLIIE